MPNPKAALALLRRLEGLTGVAVEASELEDEIEPLREQVDRAVSANPEIEELVHRLEAEQAEEEITPPRTSLGEKLACEFQRFLRQQDS